MSADLTVCYISGRSSSRVLNAPGGASSFSFGMGAEPAAPVRQSGATPGTARHGNFIEHSVVNASHGTPSKTRNAAVPEGIAHPQMTPQSARRQTESSTNNNIFGTQAASPVSRPAAGVQMRTSSGNFLADPMAAPVVPEIPLEHIKHVVTSDENTLSGNVAPAVNENAAPMSDAQKTFRANTPFGVDGTFECTLW